MATPSDVADTLTEDELWFVRRGPHPRFTVRYKVKPTDGDKTVTAAVSSLEGRRLVEHAGAAPIDDVGVVNAETFRWTAFGETVRRIVLDRDARAA